jgi:iron complex outermembrane recepter protein
MVFCFGLFAQLANAQATLTGTVTNAATGRTLEGASVAIKGTDRETFTDRQGTYRFENLPAGTITLVVSYTGLSPTETAIDLRSGPRVQDVGLTADIYTLSQFVVSGEREGNAQAITLQKLSAGVKSIVSTDAFGNLAGNPADLLVKLPGVEGVYCSDQMRYVRIRGLHQNLTTVTMDGNRLANGASAGANRDFQFQTVNSETVERLEVVKSPTPDMDGDSIGGAVNMVSKSAFDNSGERRVRVLFGVTSRWTDPRPKKFPPQFAFSYSEVFGGKLAVAINYNYRRIYTLSDYTSQSYEQLPAGVTTPAYRYSVGLTDYREETTRRGGGIRFDYKVNDNIRFYLNGTENNITEHEYDSYVTWSTNQAVATRDASGNLTGPNGIVPGYTENFTEVRAVPNSTAVLRSTSPYKDGVANYLGFGGVHRYDTLNIDYNLYISTAKTNYAAQKQLSLVDRNVGFTVERGSDEFFPIVRQTAGADWTQLSSYTENIYSRSGMAGWDKFEGASLNVKKDFTTPVPTYIKVGARQRKQTRKLETSPWNGAYVGPDGVMGVNPATGLNDDNLAQFGTASPREMASHEGYYPSVPNPEHPARGNNVFDTLFFTSPQYFSRNLASDLQNQLTGNQRFKEDITAYYIMGSVDLGKLSILGGVRVETTKVDAEGALQVITPEERDRRAAFVGPLTDAEIIRRTTAEFGGRQSRSGDNRYVLPGLHFKYSPDRNLVARLSYATNIGRPSIGQLIPRTNVNYEAQTLSTSNPSLKPQTADNFDLSAEYYFEPAGVVSVGLFLKELKGFIYTAGGATVPTGADNGFGGEYAGYTFTTQYNGGSAKIKGFEINYSQQFTFLPGIWKGLGAYANFTKMEAEGNYGSGSAISLQPTPKIAGFNPTTGNLGLSYIRNKITLRAQATYRGRYLATYNVNESRLVYFRERLRLDIKTAYQLSKRFEFYLDVNNILPVEGGDNQDTGGRASSYGWHSPLWSFGVNTRL